MKRNDWRGCEKRNAWEKEKEGRIIRKNGDKW